MNKTRAGSLLGIFFQVAGGNGVRQALFAFGNLYVARQVSEKAFGLVGLGFSLYLLAAGFIDFGGRLYYWRRLASSRREGWRNVAGLYLLARLALGLPVCLVLLLACAAWSVIGGPGLLVGAYVCAALFAQASFDWVLLAREQVGRLSAFNAIAGILFLGGVGLFVRGDADIIWFPVWLGASYGVAALVCVLPVVRFQHVTIRRLRVAVVGSVRARTQYAGFDLLQRLHAGYMTVVLAVVGGYALAGQWRVAQIGYQLIVTLATYAGYAAFTRVVREEFDMRRAVSRLLPGLWGIVPVVAIVSGLAYWGVRWAIGPGYDVAGGMLGILIGGAAITAVGVFVRETLVAEGSARRACVALCLVVGLATGVACLTTVWGFVYGPAIGVVAAELVVLTALLGSERIVRSASGRLGWLGGGIAQLGSAACGVLIMKFVIGG